MDVLRNVPSLSRSHLKQVQDSFISLNQIYTSAWQQILWNGNHCFCRWTDTEMSLTKPNYVRFMLRLLLIFLRIELIVSNAPLMKSKTQHATPQWSDGNEMPITMIGTSALIMILSTSLSSRWTFLSCFLHARLHRSFLRLLTQMITSIGAFQLALSIIDTYAGYL